MIEKQKQNRFEISICFLATVCGSRYGIHDNVKHERVVTVLSNQVSCKQVLNWVDWLNTLADENVDDAIKAINKVDEAIMAINSNLPPAD